MIHTDVCDRIGIEYPIFQGGMAWVSEHVLAAAVSNAGGLGIISAMNAPGEYLRKEIRACREMTDRPFGVNVMLMSPHAPEVAKVILEEKVPVVTTGAGLPNFMKIPGESLIGVYSANEFLTRINLMKAYLHDYDTPIVQPRAVAVVGGGNVAMDAARCAKRLGAEKVYIVYRRSEEEMPARLEEIHHAKEEGIEFRLLQNPVAIHGDENGKVQKIECVEMVLGEPDASGRRRPVEKKDSNFTLDVDCVVIAIGNSPNPLVHSTTPGLDTNRKGCLIVEEGSLKTTREGVYAGGDAVTGAATVILAMGAGKEAAAEIDNYIKSKA